MVLVLKNRKRGRDESCIGADLMKSPVRKVPNFRLETEQDILAALVCSKIPNNLSVFTCLAYLVLKSIVHRFLYTFPYILTLN